MKRKGQPDKAPKARGSTTIEQYSKRTPNSKVAYEEAEQWIAGGVTRGAGSYYLPYPLFIERGEGPYVYDVDGHRLVDFLNCSFALPLGHAHPKVMAAIRAQLEKGLFFTAPNPIESEMARLLCQRVPSVEKVRFTGTGTEATMFALRLARAFTKRDKIAKMDGGFHGTHDSVEIGNGVMAGGGIMQPGEKRASPGVPKVLLDETEILPFNDAEECERIIRKNKDDLAAVIVEPVMGSAGMITPRNNFLKALREMTTRYGILLIFDEMISMGIARGGGQEYYNVLPDLTAMGKVIGGGMPMGAFGGRADLMALVDPTKGPAAVNHGGTFSGHPLSMVSGIAQINEMTPEVYAKLHRMGDDFRNRLKAMFKRIEAPMSVTGVGQLFTIHATPEEPYDYATSGKSDYDLMRLLNMALQNRGYYLTTRGRGSVSAAMTEEHITGFIRALEEGLEENYATGVKR